MNLKIKIILLVGVFLMSIGGIVYSQGVFKNNSTASGKEITNSTGVFATEQETLTATGKPGPGGGDVPGEGTPIGEGLAILSLLSGGYLMLKKRKSKDGQ